MAHDDNNNFIHIARFEHTAQTKQTQHIRHHIVRSIPNQSINTFLSSLRYSFTGSKQKYY